MTYEKILHCLYRTVDEVNLERDEGRPLEKSTETPIYGAESELDSLGLVNFIVIAEDNLEEAFGTHVMLNDERALTTEPSPFLTIETLAKYVEDLLGRG